MMALWLCSLASISRASATAELGAISRVQALLDCPSVVINIMLLERVSSEDAIQIISVFSLMPACGDMTIDLVTVAIALLFSSTCTPVI